MSLILQHLLPSGNLLGSPLQPFHGKARRRVVSPFRLSPPPLPYSPSGPSFMASSARSQGRSASPSSMNFPFLSPSHRELMLDLQSAIDDRLGPYLLPSSVPADVLSFQNAPGTCKGAVDIRSGADDSMVTFVLESWLHCELPFGVLDITTLFAFLNDETDAPHLLMEFVQNGSSSLILYMDLLPRRDLVLYSDYLDNFYQQTPLEKVRQDLQGTPQVAPYLSSSLYIRGALSPTAIAVNITCRPEDGRSIEDAVKDHVAPAAKKVLETWLNKCACGERKMLEEADRAALVKRDKVMSNKTLEIDLASNLPRLFGQEVADRVIATIQTAYGM